MSVNELVSNPEKPDDLERAEKAIEIASEELSRLCKARWKGEKAWVKAWHWEIPANEERDTDLRIGAAIDIAKELLAEVRRLRASAPPLPEQAMDALRFYSAILTGAPIPVDGLRSMPDAALLNLRASVIAEYYARGLSSGPAQAPASTAADLDADHRLTETELEAANKIYQDVVRGRRGRDCSTKAALEQVIRGYLAAARAATPAPLPSVGGVTGARPSPAHPARKEGRRDLEMRMHRNQ